MSRPRVAKVAKGSALALVLVAAVMMVCAITGIVATRDNDLRIRSERHAGLLRALDELRPVFGDRTRYDARELQQLERRTGLSDLRFGAEPVVADGREIQSLQDAHGRIVGWFSWAPRRGFVLAMYWLFALIGIGGVALIICTAMVRRTTRGIARELARIRDRMRKLLSEDALTGLPNQRVMLETLDRLLESTLPAGTPASPGGTGPHIAFARIDIDGFREVNDAVGREGGDAVILKLTKRLKAGLPKGALLGRFKGNEFSAFLVGDSADTAILLEQALRAAICDPIVVGQTWRFTAGIGIAQAPEDGATADDLARRAGMTLRAAKAIGRGISRRFEPQIEHDHAEHGFLLRELKSAVAGNSFEVHYQPIVAANGAGVVGVEALLRWMHPTRGAIPPSVFVPIAEKHGLMGELGAFVLRRALSDAARWRNLFVAVNLSPAQIRDPQLVDLVRSVLDEADIDGARVVLEMTESILIDDPQETQVRLDALRALGVSIALDDFGSGYSSLSYLQRFPFERLKIDRAFVASLGTIGNAGAIIQSIVTLGHALGMVVLAEGIETEEQRVLLRLAGCDEMQGFLFAKPSPAAAIDGLVDGDGMAPPAWSPAPARAAF